LNTGGFAINLMHL